MRDFDIWDLEHMAARFNPLPTGNGFLDARYEWQRKENGVEWPYYRFFYHLAKMLKPALVVELGGWQGTAAAHFAAGYFNNYVLSIDHHSDPNDDVHQAKMLEAVERYNNLIYLQGWTSHKIAISQVGQHTRDELSVYPYVLQYTKFASKIDILFIDSWHVYEYAKMDWKSYKPLLNSTSLVICDDIIAGEEENAPISGMMRFWQEMPEPKFLNDNLHPGSRMGFIKYGN